MKRSVLVTGASGFVGMQVLSHMLDLNVRIVVIIREISREKISSLGHPIEIISSSDLFLESEEWWISVLQNIDTVIHLAWYAEPGKYLHSSKNIECLQGTLVMGRAASRSGVRRFIGIGTCAEYDSDCGYVSISSRVNPRTIYASCKASLFFTLSSLFEGSNVEFAWCRIFFLYGEGEDARRLSPFLRAKFQAGEVAELRGGNNVRDFLDVKAAGKMIAETAVSSEQGAVNICSGIPVTVREFAEKIADEYGARHLLKYGMPDSNSFDPPCLVGVL
jgi:nucleoside-diphosphate-sugar epimerase